MNKKLLLLPFFLIINSCGYYYYPTIPSQQYYYKSNVLQTVKKETCTCKNSSSVKEDNNKKTISTTINQDKETIKDNKKNDEVNTNDKLLQTIIKNMTKAEENNKAYEMVFTNYSKGTMKDGKDTGKIRELTVKTKINVKKPSSFKMNILDSSDSMAKGSTIVYTGNKKIKVKAGGVLGLIPISLDTDDPMFQNARGHTIMSILDGIRRILLKETKIELLGTTYIDNNKVYTLKIIPAEKLDKEITHEIYYIDTETFLVKSYEMFVDKDMVFKYKVEDIKLNINIEDNFFTL